MHFASISTVILAAIAMLGVAVGGMKWLYSRGAQERAVTDTQKLFARALDENTSSTRELTAELRDFKDRTVTTLHEHEIRLTVLEQAK
jgi:hypothetical protein